MSSDALRDRFDRFDGDNNGKIDQAELSSLLDALGLGYTDSQVHATFTELDTDANGQIDFEEFCGWWTSL